MGADGGLRRPRQPPLADDGRDLGHGDPRADARQAARRHATSAGSPSCRATSRSRCPSATAEVDDLAAALQLARRAAGCARGDGRAPRARWPRRPRPRARRGASGGGVRAGRRWALASRTTVLREVERRRRRASASRRARPRPRRSHGGSPRSTSVGELAAARVAGYRTGRGSRRSSSSRRRVRLWLGRGMAAPFIFVDELIYCGARAEPRRQRLVRGARRADERLQPPLPGADRAGVLAVRRPAERVRRGEGDERDRDVARGGARLAARPPGERAVARAPRRACSRSPLPVDGVHGDARDREALLPGRARCSRGRSCACSSGRSWAAHRVPRRRARRGLRDALAGARVRRGDRARRRSCSRSLRAELRRVRPFAPAARRRRRARLLARGRRPGGSRAGRSPTSSARTASSARAATTSARRPPLLALARRGARRCTSASSRSSRSSSSLARRARLPARLQEHVAATVALVATSTLVVGDVRRRASRPTGSRTATSSSSRRLLVVALLGVGRARGAAAAHRARGRRAVVAVGLVVAFPYARFIGEPAKSDTFGLIPLWTANEHLLGDSYRVTVLVAALALVGARGVVPAALAVAVPLVLLALFVVLSRPVWSGPHGVLRSGEGALFQGIRGVDARLDRRRGARRRRGGRALDGTRRPLHRQPERVLQPARRATSTTPRSPTPGGIGETAVQRRPGDGIVRTADGATIDAPYALLDGSVTPDGDARRARRRPRDDALAAARAARVADEGRRGSTRTTRGRAAGNVAPARGARAASCSSRLHSDPTLFAGASPHVLATVARPARSRGSRVPPRGHGHAARSPRAGRRHVRRRFTVTPTLVPAEVLPGSTDDRELGVHFDAFVHERARMRIVVDVSPAVASAHGDRQLHPRLARRDGRGVGRRATSSSRSRRRACAGPARDPRGARGHPRRAAARAAARLARAPDGVEPRSAGRRSSGSSATLDAFVFSEWMYPAQRARSARDGLPRPRPAPPSRSGARARTVSMHTSEGPARRGDVRRRVRQLRASRRPTSSRRPRDRRGPDRARPPGPGATGSGPTGPRPTSAARRFSASGRSSRARTSRGSSRRGACSTASSASCSQAGRAGATGPTSPTHASAASATCPTRRSRASTAAPRCTSTRRSSRASGSR